MTDTAAIRYKLYDYIRVAEDKKLHAIYNLLEEDIEQAAEWWKDKKLIVELDDRYATLEKGADKGFTLGELENSITELRRRKYGR